MPDLSIEGLSGSARSQLRGHDDVDLLVGIPSFDNAATVAHVVRAVEAGLRTHFPASVAMIVVADGHSTDDTVHIARGATTVGAEEALLLDPSSRVPAKVVVPYVGISGKGSALRTVFAAATALQAKACAVLDADLRSITPEWVNRLLRPVLDGGYDFVAPVYDRYKLDGTITNSIAFPLTAALYGSAVRQPIGGEFGFSPALAKHWARQPVWHTDVARFGIDAFMTTVAVAEGFRVCQAVLGAKIHDARDPALHLGPMFRQVVGTLFDLAGRYESRWRETGALEEVPTFGFPTAAAPEAFVVDTDRLAWRLVQGYVEHRETWEAALAPDTMAQVIAAIRGAGDSREGPRIPVELWIRVCYDHLVASLGGLADPETLEDSLLPLYLGRTATFAREVADESAEATEARVAGYAGLFAAERPYLLQRLEAVRAEHADLDVTDSDVPTISR